MPLINTVAITCTKSPRSAKVEALQERQQQRSQQQIREQQQQQRREQQQQQQQQRPVQRQPIAVTTTPTPVPQITEKQIRQRQQIRNYHEDEYEPASEVESDRQQRVYRGQPSTIGQVQRDRDGLRRNVISVILLFSVLLLRETAQLNIGLPLLYKT